MPNYNLTSGMTLDVAGARSAGQNLAQNEMKTQRLSEVEGIRQQAVSSGYDPKQHKQLLQDSGYFEEALDIDNLLTKKTTDANKATEAALNIVSRTAEITAKTGAMAWPILRSSLIEAGAASPEDLPEGYDDRAKELAESLGSKADEMRKVIKFRSGNMEHQEITQGGRVVAKGAPYAVGASGDATALQKNVPFLARVMKISESEAAQMLTESKDKSDEAIYLQLYNAAMRSNFGDAEEADKSATRGLDTVKKMRDEKYEPSDNKKTKADDPMDLDAFFGTDFE